MWVCLVPRVSLAVVEGGSHPAVASSAGNWPGRAVAGGGSSLWVREEQGLDSLGDARLAGRRTHLLQASDRSVVLVVPAQIQDKKSAFVL